MPCSSESEIARPAPGWIGSAMISAAQSLLELFKACREQGVTVAVARLESVRAQAAFERFGLYDVLPKDHVFLSVDEAVRKLAAG